MSTRVIPEKPKETAPPPTAEATFGEKAKREAIAWLWIILAFLFINGVIGQARVIPSASMENTMLIGDHLIMDRFGFDAGVPFTSWHVPLWRSPKRQEIIIFRAPVEGSPDFVKRVIGMPGDTLEIHDGAVWLNGARLNEPYIKESMDALEKYGPVTVPPNSYFAMGDNRSDSYDSRYWGFVPRANLIGVPVMIYLSIDAPTPHAWEPGHLTERFEAYGNAIIHPSRIRWGRFFRVY